MPLSSEFKWFNFWNIKINWINRKDGRCIHFRNWIWTIQFDLIITIQELEISPAELSHQYASTQLYVKDSLRICAGIQRIREFVFPSKGYDVGGGADDDDTTLTSVSLSKQFLPFCGFRCYSFVLTIRIKQQIFVVVVVPYHLLLPARIQFSFWGSKIKFCMRCDVRMEYFVSSAYMYDGCHCLCVCESYTAPCIHTHYATLRFGRALRAYSDILDTIIRE